MFKKYRQETSKNMVSLGVYKSEFDTFIDVYAGMLAQYEIMTNRLIKDDFNIEVETQRGGTRKSATATAQEKLRNDLVVYSDRLMLNPKALKNAKIDPKKENSKLHDVLSKMEETNLWA